jgi:hypothetical protein
LNIHVSVIGGVIVACCYALSAGLLWRLGRSIENTRLRFLVVAPLGIFLLALPWSEEVSIAWRFKVACDGAGFVDGRQVQADGFLDRSRSIPARHAREGLVTTPAAIRDFDRLGYRFIEYPISNGRVLHQERAGDGLSVTILERPVAKYAYQVDFRNARMDRGILCSEESVVEIGSQRVVATYRRCGRIAGTLAFNPFQVESCPTEYWRPKGMLYGRAIVPSRN